MNDGRIKKPASAAHAPRRPKKLSPTSTQNDTPVGPGSTWLTA